ncbi:LacI family transcriptional regulator [Yoonia sediminilitoris]|uniref:LacI family transcriptional regulator n=1 Tax=Yoonia sediminilitoris TaxID=1286148 RepID=A0A2T6KPI2_9RHOB|nr:LacI family transcriptional regulator [Yoonia sediminilitoris]PUB18452.1 LacI family transcriptional regulator [Yoonia sediminilitoris]RCW98620.1 LacI family transcriptional regulator [Yoonia sediminilitoris]
MPGSKLSAEQRSALLPAGTKPTLKTISKISGLAVPTVSRALNDAPDIGRDTKKLIRQIADEIGYVPNRAGVRLRTGRTNVISLIMSTEHDNHTARLISSVAEGLQGTNFHLNVTPYAPGDDIMKPIRYIVETGSADGVIFNQIEPNDPRIAYLMERDFPFATHGRSNWSDQHAYYDFDNEAYGRRAINMLHARNRKHVAVVAPPQKQSYALHLVAGLRERAEANQQSLFILDTVTSDSPSPDVADALIAHLKAHPQTDTVVTASAGAAMGAVAAAEACGRTIGKDFDIFAKEAAPFLKLVRSDILTMAESVGSAGEFLAKAAIQAIRHPELAPMQHLEVPEKPEQ